MFHGCTVHRKIENTEVVIIRSRLTGRFRHFCEWPLPRRFQCEAMTETLESKLLHFHTMLTGNYLVRHFNLSFCKLQIHTVVSVMGSFRKTNTCTRSASRERNKSTMRYDVCSLTID